MKRLYKCTPETIHPNNTEYEIREETPKLFKAYPKQLFSIKSVLWNIYWFVMTKGKYRVWCAYDGESVIHTSYVVPKCFKFPFLSCDHYEIGPCHTNSNYRGKNIYPSVLTCIVSKNGGGVRI